MNKQPVNKILKAVDMIGMPFSIKFYYDVGGEYVYTTTSATTLDGKNIEYNSTFEVDKLLEIFKKIKANRSKINE